VSRVCITEMPEGVERSPYIKFWWSPSDRWYIKRVRSFIERDFLLMSHLAIQGKYNVSDHVVIAIKRGDVIVEMCRQDRTR
jgi:hypothetical protein